MQGQQYAIQQSPAGEQQSQRLFRQASILLPWFC